jgi:hypothetical protein
MHQPFLFQQHERFADRRTAGVISPRQFDRVEVITWLAQAFDNFGRDLAGDIGNERRPIVPLGNDCACDGNRALKRTVILNLQSGR